MWQFIGGLVLGVLIATFSQISIDFFKENIKPKWQEHYRNMTNKGPSIWITRNEYGEVVDSDVEESRPVPYFKGLFRHFIKKKINN